MHHVVYDKDKQTRQTHGRRACKLQDAGKLPVLLLHNPKDVSQQAPPADKKKFGQHSISNKFVRN